MIIEDEVKKEEGFSEKGYLDTKGKITWGYGFTYITKYEAEFILRNRISDIQRYLVRYKWYLEMNEERKRVVQNMVYQLGINGFLSFKKTIGYFIVKDYKNASMEMLDSKWHKDTPARCERLAKIMLNGVDKNDISR